MNREKSVITGSMDDSDDNDRQPGSHAVVEKVRPMLKKPPLYKVVLLNDDFTPMDFVIIVLETFFGMGREQATRVMLKVHTEGKGVCGVFTRDIAETKAAQVNQYSRENEQPLLCEIEPAEDNEQS